MTARIAGGANMFNRLQTLVLGDQNIDTLVRKGITET
jgi:chemotaxis receptor (MCP) glutamine deamidase CheD